MKIPTTRKMFFLIGLVALGMNSCTENTEANSSSEDSEEISANNETSSEKKSPVIIGDLEIAAEDFPEKTGWGEAKQECQKMGDGWRLPTIDELFTIYDNREKIGGFDEYAGYWSVKKETTLYYYKCQTCKNATINADTGKKSKGIGAHDMFKSVLSLIQLDASLVEPFKQQLRYTYESLNEDQSKEKDHLLNELNIQTDKLNVLKKRFAFGEIDKSIYEEFSSEQIKKINDVSERIEKLTGKISNLENYIDISVDVVKNLNKYWGYESVESKRRIQNVVFPEGLVVDTEKRQYLTKKINTVFTVSASVSGGNQNKKSDSEKIFPHESLLVPEAGIEPALRCQNRILNPARLPVPPLGLTTTSEVFQSNPSFDDHRVTTRLSGISGCKFSVFIEFSNFLGNI